MCKYTNGLEAFSFNLEILSLYAFTSCYIFVAGPFLSVNPGAFPKEVKWEQTTIKLIEAARYQFRCLRPWQHILHWPCRTLALCYLSKFNSWPAATDPAAASLSLNSSDWSTHSNTHRPDYHAGEGPPLWVRPKHEGLAGPYPPAAVSSSPDSLSSHFAASSAAILTNTSNDLFFNSDLKWYLVLICLLSFHFSQ